MFEEHEGTGIITKATKDLCLVSVGINGRKRILGFSRGVFYTFGVKCEGDLTNIIENGMEVDLIYLLSPSKNLAFVVMVWRGHKPELTANVKHSDPKTESVVYNQLGRVNKILDYASFLVRSYTMSSGVVINKNVVYRDGNLNKPDISVGGSIMFDELPSKSFPSGAKYEVICAWIRKDPRLVSRFGLNAIGSIGSKDARYLESIYVYGKVAVIPNEIVALVVSRTDCLVDKVLLFRSSFKKRCDRIQDIVKVGQRLRMRIRFGRLFRSIRLWFATQAWKVHANFADDEAFVASQALVDGQGLVDNQALVGSQKNVDRHSLVDSHTLVNNQVLNVGQVNGNYQVYDNERFFDDYVSNGQVSIEDKFRGSLFQSENNQHNSGVQWSGQIPHHRISEGCGNLLDSFTELAEVPAARLDSFDNRADLGVRMPARYEAPWHSRWHRTWQGSTSFSERITGNFSGNVRYPKDRVWSFNAQSAPTVSYPARSAEINASVVDNCLINLNNISQMRPSSFGEMLSFGENRFAPVTGPITSITGAGVTEVNYNGSIGDNPKVLHTGRNAISRVSNSEEDSLPTLVVVYGDFTNLNGKTKVNDNPAISHDYSVHGENPEVPQHHPVDMGNTAIPQSYPTNFMNPAVPPSLQATFRNPAIPWGFPTSFRYPAVPQRYPAYFIRPPVPYQYPGNFGNLAFPHQYPNSFGDPAVLQGYSAMFRDSAVSHQYPRSLGNYSILNGYSGSFENLLHPLCNPVDCGNPAVPNGYLANENNSTDSQNFAASSANGSLTYPATSSIPGVLRTTPVYGEQPTVVLSNPFSNGNSTFLAPLGSGINPAVQRTTEHGDIAFPNASWGFGNDPAVFRADLRLSENPVAPRANLSFRGNFNPPFQGLGFSVDPTNTCTSLELDDKRVISHTNCGNLKSPTTVPFYSEELTIPLLNRRVGRNYTFFTKPPRLFNVYSEVLYWFPPLQGFIKRASTRKENDLAVISFGNLTIGAQSGDIYVNGSRCTNEQFNKIVDSGKTLVQFEAILSVYPYPPNAFDECKPTHDATCVWVGNKPSLMQIASYLHEQNFSLLIPEGVFFFGEVEKFYLPKIALVKVRPENTTVCLHVRTFGCKRKSLSHYNSGEDCITEFVKWKQCLVFRLSLEDACPVPLSAIDVWVTSIPKIKALITIAKRALITRQNDGKDAISAEGVESTAVVSGTLAGIKPVIVPREDLLPMPVPCAKIADCVLLEDDEKSENVYTLEKEVNNDLWMPELWSSVSAHAENSLQVLSFTETDLGSLNFSASDTESDENDFMSTKVSEFARKIKSPGAADCASSEHPSEQEPITESHPIEILSAEKIVLIETLPEKVPTNMARIFKNCTSFSPQRINNVPREPVADAEGRVKTFENLRIERTTENLPEQENVAELDPNIETLGSVRCWSSEIGPKQRSRVDLLLTKTYLESANLPASESVASAKLVPVTVPESDREIESLCTIDYMSTVNSPDLVTNMTLHSKIQTLPTAKRVSVQTMPEQVSSSDMDSVIQPSLLDLNLRTLFAGACLTKIDVKVESDSEGVPSREHNLGGTNMSASETMPVQNVTRTVTSSGYGPKIDSLYTVDHAPNVHSSQTVIDLKLCTEMENSFSHKTVSIEILPEEVFSPASEIESFSMCEPMEMHYLTSLQVTDVNPNIGTPESSRMGRVSPENLPEQKITELDHNTEPLGAVKCSSTGSELAEVFCSKSDLRLGIVSVSMGSVPELVTSSKPDPRFEALCGRASTQYELQLLSCTVTDLRVGPHSSSEPMSIQVAPVPLSSGTEADPEVFKSCAFECASYMDVSESLPYIGTDTKPETMPAYKDLSAENVTERVPADTGVDLIREAVLTVEPVSIDNLHEPVCDIRTNRNIEALGILQRVSTTNVEVRCSETYPRTGPIGTTKPVAVHSSVPVPNVVSTTAGARGIGPSFIAPVPNFIDNVAELVTSTESAASIGSLRIRTYGSSPNFSEEDYGTGTNPGIKTMHTSASACVTPGTLSSEEPEQATISLSTSAGGSSFENVPPSGVFRTEISPRTDVHFLNHPLTELNNLVAQHRETILKVCANPSHLRPRLLNFFGTFVVKRSHGRHEYKVKHSLGVSFISCNPFIYKTKGNIFRGYNGMEIRFDAECTDSSQSSTNFVVTTMYLDYKPSGIDMISPIVACPETPPFLCDGPYRGFIESIPFHDVAVAAINDTLVIVPFEALRLNFDYGPSERLKFLSINAFLKLGDEVIITGIKVSTYHSHIRYDNRIVSLEEFRKIAYYYKARCCWKVGSRDSRSGDTEDQGTTKEYCWSDKWLHGEYGRKEIIIKKNRQYYVDFITSTVNRVRLTLNVFPNNKLFLDGKIVDSDTLRCLKNVPVSFHVAHHCNPQNSVDWSNVFYVKWAWIGREPLPCEFLLDELAVPEDVVENGAYYLAVLEDFPLPTVALCTIGVVPVVLSFPETESQEEFNVHSKKQRKSRAVVKAQQNFYKGLYFVVAVDYIDGEELFDCKDVMVHCKGKVVELPCPTGKIVPLGTKTNIAVSFQLCSVVRPGENIANRAERFLWFTYLRSAIRLETTVYFSAAKEIDVSSSAERDKYRAYEVWITEP